MLSLGFETTYAIPRILLSSLLNFQATALELPSLQKETYKFKKSTKLSNEENISQGGTIWYAWVIKLSFPPFFTS